MLPNALISVPATKPAWTAIVSHDASVGAQTASSRDEQRRDGRRGKPQCHAEKLGQRDDDELIQPRDRCVLNS